MPPPPAIGEEPEEQDWLVTYADAITLLMAFFVMLVSFSKIDLPLFEAVMAGIQEEIGMGDSDAVSTSGAVASALESAAFELEMEQTVDVYKDEKGVVIEMASKSFFKPGTAQLLDSAIPLLKSWSDFLIQDKYKYFFIEVEGHTDNDPINTVQFPSNWELSSSRAAAVVRVMQGNDVEPYLLKVAGLGSSHPKLPNNDHKGAPIKANQKKNRRVEIHLIQMVKKEKDQFDTFLLERRLDQEEQKRAVEDEKRRKAVQDALAEEAAKSGAQENAPVPAQQ